MESISQDEKEQQNVTTAPVLLLPAGHKKFKTKIAVIFFLLVIIFIAVVSYLLTPPIDFPQNKIITIEKGASLHSVAVLLERENMIRTQILFEFCAKIVGGKKPVSADDYLFKEPISTCAVVSRIADGISGIPAVRLTVPEGMSNKGIAGILSKKIPQFDVASFLEVADSQEGSLFPDTYFLRENVTGQTVVNVMFANFNKKVATLESEIVASGHTQRDIIIMASILEKEATTNEDKAIVSGVLWKRIEIGMPLQVDATFMYLLGKTSSELTVSDLQMKSAYNTYQNKGLPAGPIGNPGIDAIRAAIHPTLSPYLYYLSDRDGVMHYAKTFAEHKANKAKYLR